MEDTHPVEKPSKESKKPRVAKPRPAARPYKKLDDNVLGVRVETMKKQMDIFSSKMVLLKARLSNSATLRGSR